MLADGASTYLYGAERLAQAGTDLAYYGADGLASVRQLYDPAGQIVANRRYQPFGSLVSGTGTSIYGFAGEPGTPGAGRQIRQDSEDMQGCWPAS